MLIHVFAFTPISVSDTWPNLSRWSERLRTPILSDLGK